MIHKIKSHKEKLKNEPKILIIIGMFLLLSFLLFANLKEKKAFNIEDKCGKFVNLISHTIEDETKCRTRCKGQCNAEDLQYSKIEFTEPIAGCNQCICHCR